MSYYFESYMNAYCQGNVIRGARLSSAENSNIYISDQFVRSLSILVEKISSSSYSCDLPDEQNIDIQELKDQMAELDCTELTTLISEIKNQKSTPQLMALANTNFNFLDEKSTRAIENIYFLIQKNKISDQDKIFFLNLQELLSWLQVIKSDSYQQSLFRLASFKVKSHLSVSDLLYRFVSTFNLGVGTAIFALVWIPMIVLGSLGACSIICPPLLLFLMPIILGVASVVLGGFLIYSQHKAYQSEDKVFLKAVNDAENEVFRNAHKLSGMQINYFGLKVKKIILEKKWKKAFCPILAFKEPIRSSEQNQEQDKKEPSFKRYFGRWAKVAMTFVGILSFLWGFPKLILEMCGIPLLMGTAFTSVGLIVFAAAVLFGAALFSYKAYRYDKKSNENELIFKEIQEENASILKGSIKIKKQEIFVLQQAVTYLEGQLAHQESIKQSSFDCSESTAEMPKEKASKLMSFPWLGFCRQAVFSEQQKDSLTEPWQENNEILVGLTC